MNSRPPALNRILESSLYVSCLDRSAEFYRVVIGLEVVLRDDRMCALAIPDRQVLLLFRRGGSDRPSKTPFGIIPPHDANGSQHLCFSITHEVIAAWRSHLLSFRISIESEVVQPHGGSSLYFRDPDGHSIELGTAGLWANDPVEDDERNARREG
jgi:catechol 2,3-dioxygenase-like lactoylglutathione lyase family enzyme